MAASSTGNTQVVTSELTTGMLKRSSGGAGTTNYFRADGTWAAAVSLNDTPTPASTKMPRWTDDHTIGALDDFTFSVGELTNVCNMTAEFTVSGPISGTSVTAGSFNIPSSLANSSLVNDGSTYEIAIKGSFTGTSSKIWNTGGNSGIQGYNALAYSDTSGGSAFYVNGDEAVMYGYDGSTYKTITLDGVSVNISGIPTYADNTAAKAGSLTDDDLYRTSTGVLMIVYT